MATKQDMTAVNSEPSSLSICLSALAEDFKNHAHVISPRLVESVRNVLKICDEVVRKIEALLAVLHHLP